MVWMNQSDIEVDTVIEISSVKSGKGYVMKGVNVDYFVWKSDKAFVALLAAIAVWIDSGKGKRIELFQIDKDTKLCGFRLQVVKGKPVECTWRLAPNGYTTLEEVTEDNPFL